MSDKFRNWIDLIAHIIDKLSPKMIIALIVWFTVFYMIFAHAHDMLDIYKEQTKVNIESQKQINDLLSENEGLKNALRDINLQVFDSPYPMCIKDYKNSKIYAVNDAYISKFLDPRSISVEDFVNTRGLVLDRDKKFIYYDSLTINSPNGHFRAAIPMDGEKGEVHKWLIRGDYTTYIVVMWVPER